MQALVIKEAFYAGSRRRVGTVITLPNQTKGSWFEVLKEPKAEKGKPGTPNSPDGTGGAGTGADLV